MGRPKGIWTPEVVKKRIQATKLAERLQNHAFGKVEMTDSQRDSAKFLLGKCISAPVPKDDDGKTPQGPTVYMWQQ